MTRSRRRSAAGPGETDLLFPLPPAQAPDRTTVKELALDPLWTGSKAKLIERYLFYFVQVTKHGTYIDGFAGPQDKPDNWAAKLVLESKPSWLRHFHLFEVREAKVRRLRELRNQHPDRDVVVYKGDFNRRVDEILRPEVVSENEAVFCLLDQHTFECEWATVERIARYKTQGMKIELFYFLAHAWFHRALENTTRGDQPQRWWGRDDLRAFGALPRFDRAEEVCRRFREELGYGYASPWAIHDREEGQRVLMYHMIHATDHPAAPYLMSRAYEEAVAPKDPPGQAQMDLFSPARRRRRVGQDGAGAERASGPRPDRPAPVPQPSGSDRPTA